MHVRQRFTLLILAFVLAAAPSVPARAAQLVISLNSSQNQEWRVVSTELDGSDLQVVFENNRFIYEIAVDTPTNQRLSRTSGHFR